MPVVLPPLGDAVAYLDRLDGICLSGGPDLDPDAYGAPERHAELGPTEPGLDAFELELARAADARGLPILGICRGAQALNVARGGTLHQHLPGHRQTEPATATTHTVHVEPGSRLARRRRRRAAARELLPPPGRRRPRPRAARRRARRRRRSSRRSRQPGPRLVLGVQWHAEGLTAQPRHRALFDELVRGVLRAGARGCAAPRRAIPRVTLPAPSN